MARLASSQEAAPVCPGSRRSEIINPHYQQEQQHKISLLLLSFHLKFNLILIPFMYIHTRKMQPKLFRFFLLPRWRGVENKKPTSFSCLVVLCREEGWGGDVDIDLHSKRVGSLIKQRFVAKKLVSSLKKTSQKRRKKEKGKMKRDSFACVCVLQSTSWRSDRNISRPSSNKSSLAHCEICMEWSLAARHMSSQLRYHYTH